MDKSSEHPSGVSIMRRTKSGDFLIVDAGDYPCECDDCEECDECRADLTRARLIRQNTSVTRLTKRVAALLEKAVTT